MQRKVGRDTVAYAWQFTGTPVKTSSNTFTGIWIHYILLIWHPVITVCFRMKKKHIYENNRVVECNWHNANWEVEEVIDFVLLLIMLLVNQFYVCVSSTHSIVVCSRCTGCRLNVPRRKLQFLTNDLLFYYEFSYVSAAPCCTLWSSMCIYVFCCFIVRFSITTDSPYIRLVDSYTGRHGIM